MADKKQGVESSKSVKETVQRMNKQFARTGVYRLQDLQRVLGDPQETVKTGVVSQECASRRVKAA